MSGDEISRAIRGELEETRSQFQALLASLSNTDWNAPSRNPAWTNGQLLYHMAFAFMLIPALFWMIKFWSRMPDGFSRGFARVLDFSTPVFNWFNALGPRGQAVVFGRPRISNIYDRVHQSILRKVDSLGEEDWSLGMYYPSRWDPAFGEFMTFEELFRYPSKHFRRHLRQLSAGSLPSD